MSKIQPRDIVDELDYSSWHTAQRWRGLAQTKEAAPSVAESLETVVQGVTAMAIPGAAEAKGDCPNGSLASLPPCMPGATIS